MVCTCMHAALQETVYTAIVYIDYNYAKINVSLQKKFTTDMESQCFPQHAKSKVAHPARIWSN